MSKTDGIDPNVPSGGEDPKLGDNRIRDLAAATAEALNVDHYIGADGGADAGYNEDAVGEHLRVKFNAPLGADPPNVANKGFLYMKDVTGKVELFWQDEDGTVLQLTTGGILNAVNLTGNQTIAGNKTFSGVTVLGDTSALATSAAPAADAQLANKKYVDDQIAAIATGSRATDDDESNAMVAAHAYLANQDGFVNATFTTAAQGLNAYCRVYVDTDDNPASGGALVSQWEDTDYHNVNTKGHVGAVLVKSGEYFEVTVANTSSLGIFWTPARATLVKCTDQD